MAYHAASPASSPVARILAPLGSFFAALGALLGRLGDRMAHSIENSGRFRQVQELQAKSDAELAQMGLTRDGIARYVFGDLFYI